MQYSLGDDILCINCLNHPFSLLSSSEKMNQKIKILRCIFHISNMNQNSSYSSPLRSGKASGLLQSPVSWQYLDVSTIGRELDSSDRQNSILEAYLAQVQPHSLIYSKIEHGNGSYFAHRISSQGSTTTRSRLAWNHRRAGTESKEYA